MPHRFSPEDMHKLDSPERRADMPPEETLLNAGLRPGDTLLDLGCGSGYFALPAAGIVGPKGLVCAVDSSPLMLAELRSRTAAAGIYNLECRLDLPETEATMVLMANVLHEAADKAAFMAGAALALKPGGRLAIIEWAKRPTPQGPPQEDRLDVTEIAALLAKAGFAAPESSRLGASHLLYLSKKL